MLKATQHEKFIQDSPQQREIAQKERDQELEEAKQKQLEELMRMQESLPVDPGLPTPEKDLRHYTTDYGPWTPPDEFRPEDQFEPANLTPPEPSPLGPPLSAPDVTTPSILQQRESLPMPEDSIENDEYAEDPMEQLRILSEITGLDPKLIASFALVGKKLGEEEEQDRTLGLPTGTPGPRPQIPYSNTPPSDYTNAPPIV